MNDGPQKSSPDDPDINTVAEIVISMNRILFGLSEQEALKRENIGVAEWVALRRISDQSGVRAGRLAKELGVSPQRINQLITSLRQSGSIELRPVSDDSRARGISITAAGQAKLAAANRTILAVFTQPFEKNPRIINNLSRPLKRLANALSVRPKAPAGEAND